MALTFKKRFDMDINVYQQYFRADACFGGVPRKGASVLLVSHSEGGSISYEAAVTFFPHMDEDDFAVSYDAYFSREVYSAKGRRSRKREASILEELRSVIDEISSEHDASVLWDEPLREASLG